MSRRRRLLWSNFCCCVAMRAGDPLRTLAEKKFTPPLDVTPPVFRIPMATRRHRWGALRRLRGHGCESNQSGAEGLQATKAPLLQREAATGFAQLSNFLNHARKLARSLSRLPIAKWRQHCGPPITRLCGRATSIRSSKNAAQQSISLRLRARRPIDGLRCRSLTARLAAPPRNEK